MALFDKALPILSGTPQFNLLWSSQPTPSGHYVAAFLNANVPAPRQPPNAEQLVLLASTVTQIFNVGFVVLGQSPASASTAQAQAFANSVRAYARENFSAVARVGGMILWLDQLRAINRDTDFGLFMPAANVPGSYPYQLDQRQHRLFDAGGANRLLAIDAGGPAATLAASGMTLTVSGSTLPLSFGNSSYYAGRAVSPPALSIPLDSTQTNAGCVIFNGLVGPGLRNFELGFEHGFTPQGGLGSSGDMPPFRLFNPLLDGTEMLNGATVRAQLNPLIPTIAAYNTLTLAPATPMVTGYRTRLGDPVTLMPASGALFQATPCQTTRAYFAPTGNFTLGAPARAATAPNGLMGGLSSLEYLAFASGDTLSFTPAQSAAITATTVAGADGKPTTTFAPIANDRNNQVSWATLLPGAARNYVCESDLSPLFGSAPATTPLTFTELALAQVLSGNKLMMPLLPQASLDFGADGQSGNAGAGPAIAAAFERGYVAPTRLASLEAGPQPTSGDGIALTPQGYVVQYAGGVIQSITLGTIVPSGELKSSGELTFSKGSAADKLWQGLCNAFLANQQFIVATCLSSELQGSYTATANLSGWAFDVSLPTPEKVVPGAYQTVLIIKSAAGTIKSLAAEPYAWTAYDTFNNSQNDGTGQMLSNWLVAYLAQAESLYADGTGLTSLQTFHDLINDADWNGYIFLQVPIEIGELDPSIEFLTAGIDTSQFFAHHVGCALNHTKVTTVVKKDGTTGPGYAANSAYLGLVHYLRPGTNPDDLSGTPPFVPQSVSYDFQLLTLDARFENSALVDFRSSAQLLMSVLFGDSVASSSPDPNVPATNAVMIYGAMQTLNGEPHYVFATSKGSSSTFFLSSAAFDRIEIDRAVVQVGDEDSDHYRIATFQMSGWFGLLTATFDVLSFAAIQFDHLQLAMRFKTGTQSTYTMATDGVTLGQMPPRVATANERITAASAAANTIYRTSSLASGFPLTLSRLMTVTDASQTPASLGYRDLATQTSLGGTAPSAPWYGVELDLPLGGGGALSSGSLFTAKMLFTWMPGGSGDVAIQPYFMLQGPGGANLTLEIEGVLKLGAAGIYLSRNTAGQFILQLASLGITVLSMSFPPAGTTNLLLAGVTQGDQRYLGWFGAYVEQTS
jgi:hypothetical protein